MHSLLCYSMKPLLAALLLAICVAVAVAANSPSIPIESYNAANVLYPYKRAAVYLDTSLSAILQQGLPANTAAVLVVGGSSQPSRRGVDEDLLRFSPAAAAAIPRAVQSALLSGMQAVEAMRGVRLFPVCLDVLPHTQDQQEKGGLPWAVFEVSSGQLLLRGELLQLLQSTPVQATAVLADACIAGIQHMAENLKQGPSLSSLSSLTSLLSASMAAGVAVAFAAAVPKWFCFVCPIVLGLLAPLVINAGVGEAANLACQAMKLPDDECVDLWFTALALGMILSLLSAVPIYKVCRLYECAHPNVTSSTAVV